MIKKNLLITVVFVTILIACNSNKSIVSQIDKSNNTSNDIVSHAHTDYFGAYKMEDPIFGTKTIVTISKNERIMITNSLPNHETGDFPTIGNPNTISAQNKTYSFPLTPKYTGNPQWIREPGIALNGVKFEPGTAEVVECDTGESYRVEAFQNLINLGLDFNHAHVQPTGAYHYHGTPTSIIEDLDAGEDLIHIGFAKDGFPIYFSKSEAYKPSFKLIDSNRQGEDCTYTNPKKTIDVSVNDHHDGTFTSDYEFVEGYGDLDECNGISIDGKYMYLVTNSFPYVSRCLMGEFHQEERGMGIRQNGARQRQNRREDGERPSFNELLEMMDTNKDNKISKAEARGPLSENFNKIDTNKDGFISKEELEKIKETNTQKPQREKK
ncbi:hypothetical protein APS56_05855 [Pseudalgibacter alginicilyticus]|uniref:EF-hand domain-containing protein n=1 Tax=Pseudalgibacter alginicilyticus TaxID=1736674 RepID=A0A0N7HYA2_9FLAO|nr:YHYH protein [Pseudalgibacter alginicilyticus]ALJ04686.1 hypothetical protein APS56_05855 [Pseudalgibacter alginicilyticus]